LESWEELRTLSKKFDLLCLIKESAETQKHSLIGAKYKADHISETHIEFDIAKAMNGVEKLKEYFGEDKPPSPEFYKKMVQLYAENGVTVWYARRG
ncbi:MAG: hypothetical protein QXJ07_05605, partial [Candidatus Bathyarchaeia archaeon]